MSDQNGLLNTDAAYVDESQGTIGFPYTTEAIGLAYNKDILDKAGVDPSTLTSPGCKFRKHSRQSTPRKMNLD